MTNKNNKLFGIVEGFFSKPLPIWDNTERKNIFKFISTYAPNINTYLYCPKDDPFVTKRPYDFYDDKKIKEFKYLISTGKINNITFIFGLNPILSELDINNVDKTIIKIVNKFNQFTKIGCRDFCLLFDDIPIAYDVLNQDINIEKNFSDKIITIVNGVYKALSSAIDSFCFCSPDYCFNKESSLTRSIKLLDKNISIFWSGNKVFSSKILLNDFNRVKKLTQSEQISLWSNYPVNDAEQNIGCFNLNGFFPPDKKVIKKINAVFVNPMREVYSNLPFLITYSDFIKNQTRYRRQQSWENALNILKINKDNQWLINVFSTANEFDIKSKNRLLNIKNIDKIEKILGNNTQNSIYGKLFINSINQLFLDAKNMIKTIQSVKNKKIIVLENFKKYDWFPTITNNARYYPEILDIVFSKLQTYPSKNTLKKMEYFQDINNWYQTKYKGKLSLQISKTDKQKLLNCINQIIEFEQIQFIKFLNNKKYLLNLKIFSYLSRKNTNRFNKKLIY